MTIRILFSALVLVLGSSMVMMKHCDAARINEEQGVGLVHPTAHYQAAMEKKLNYFLKDMQQKHRALQGDFCAQVEAGENQDGLDVDCNCSGDPTSGPFSLSCTTRSPICDGNICANASFEFQLGGSETTASVCIDFITNVYPDICIYSTVDLSNEFLDCRIVIDGRTCTACDVCNNGLGVHIDCTNIRSDLFVSDCQATNGQVFLPAFAGEPVSDGGDNSDTSPQNSSGNKAKAVVATVSAIMVIVAFAIV